MTKKEFMEAVQEADYDLFPEEALEAIYAMLKQKGDIGENTVSDVVNDFAYCETLDDCNEELGECFTSAEEMYEYYNFLRVGDAFVIYP